MAATRIWAPLLLAILINFKLQSYCNIYLDEDFNSLKSILRGNGSVGCDVFESSRSSRKCYLREMQPQENKAWIYKSSFKFRFFRSMCSGISSHWKHLQAHQHGLS